MLGLSEIAGCTRHWRLQDIPFPRILVTPRWTWAWMAMEWVWVAAGTTGAGMEDGLEPWLLRFSLGCYGGWTGFSWLREWREEDVWNPRTSSFKKCRVFFCFALTQHRLKNLLSSSKSSNWGGKGKGLPWHVLPIWMLGGGFNYFFILTPKIGEMIPFDEHIFQMGGSTTT